MKKGFFGYGRCPNCDAFLKKNDLVKNACWSCDALLKDKQNDKKIEESSNDNIKKINDCLDMIKLSSPKLVYANFNEAQQAIKNLHNKYSTIILLNKEINNCINSLIFNKDSNLIAQPNEVEIYSLGVDIFYEGLSTSVRDYFNLAANIFSICISLKLDYHQAYNRLGDCLLKIDKPMQALRMYKTAIYYISNNNSNAYIPKKAYIGDNYFKIAICQKSLESDNVNPPFVEESRKYLGKDYDELSVWGFKDWDDVVKKLY